MFSPLCDQSNYLFIEIQLTELEAGENIAKILEDEKVLQNIRKARLFQESLEAVGRNDLGKKLDQFIYTGKS